MLASLTWSNSSKAALIDKLRWPGITKRSWLSVLLSYITEEASGTLWPWLSRGSSWIELLMGWKVIRAEGY
jgi:hypothetical protein